MTQAAVLYARTEHGGHRVTKMSKGFRVDWPSGPRHYRSARKTIMALVNKPSYAPLVSA